MTAVTAPNTTQKATLGISTATSVFLDLKAKCLAESNKTPIQLGLVKHNIDCCNVQRDKSSELQATVWMAVARKARS